MRVNYDKEALKVVTAISRRLTRIDLVTTLELLLHSTDFIIPVRLIRKGLPSGHCLSKKILTDIPLLKRTFARHVNSRGYQTVEFLRATTKVVVL